MVEVMQKVQLGTDLSFPITKFVDAEVNPAVPTLVSPSLRCCSSPPDCLRNRHPHLPRYGSCCLPPSTRL